MKSFNQKTLTGLIFSFSSSKAQKWSDLSNVSYNAFGNNWDQITYKTTFPLLPTEDSSQKEYSYEYLARIYGEHGIFVSYQRHLVDVFLKRTGFQKAIRRPSVSVDRLVKTLSAKPHPLYTISRVYAEVEGYGRNLRTMSLFGDNLVDVPTFQELLPLLAAQRAELRNIRQRRNVLSIDKAGEIDFFYRNPSSLKLMLDALSFLSTGSVRFIAEDGTERTEVLEPFISW